MLARHRLILRTALLTLGSLVALTASVDGQAPTLKPIRAAYVPVGIWLPAWVAKDRGMFAEHGLDVTLSVTQNLSVLPGTAGRQYDFVASTPPDLIKAAGSGLDVVAVAASVAEAEDNPTTQLLVRADSGIATAKDLVGKVIATPTIGGVIHVSVLYWMKKQGADYTKVRAVEVPFPSMGDQLKAKRVDAVEIVEPMAGAVRAAGNVPLTAPLLGAGKDALFSFWVAQGAWARENLPLIASWKAALNEAIDFIAADPDEARRIMARYTKLSEQITRTTPLPKYRTAIAAPDIALWADLMQDVGQLPRPVDADKLVVTSN